MRPSTRPESSWLLPSGLQRRQLRTTWRRPWSRSTWVAGKGTCCGVVSPAAPCGCPGRRDRPSPPAKPSCLADVSAGSTEEVFGFVRDVQAPAAICVRPDGGGLAFGEWVGDDRRIGVVDLTTGEGRIHSISCFSYCWCDPETILHVLSSGLKLLDVTSGKSRQLLRDLEPLEAAGHLCALGEEWVEAVRTRGTTQGLREVLCVGECCQDAADGVAGSAFEAERVCDDLEPVDLLRVSPRPRGAARSMVCCGAWAPGGLFEPVPVRGVSSVQVPRGSPCRSGGPGGRTCGRAPGESVERGQLSTPASYSRRSASTLR